MRKESEGCDAAAASVAVQQGCTMPQGCAMPRVNESTRTFDHVNPIKPGSWKEVVIYHDLDLNLLWKFRLQDLVLSLCRCLELKWLVSR